MLKCCDEHCGNESGNTCKNEGGCTSALLLDDAKRACDNLVVGKHERWTGACNICQTVHGTCPVVDVAVVFDDADEDDDAAVGVEPGVEDEGAEHEVGGWRKR